ncbi:cysteine proteinase [Sanghuangporus baumii]|uniref:Cysteine proteinase n=1 Tax=Sanghuangporus baumii TaxID=108892 RepID=A0A9Q5NAQ9_SANBA|nr:cysteine proteinase [Sanghuangporus baumii]
MHALMGKSSNKSPTSQELYRARKQKEEGEKNAFLPPGLVNHGNTCFMNSVLQGLIATPMLVDIVRFSLPECYAPVSSRRSPQLTNAHGVGGEFEREREMGMPLGDTFVQLMLKAWNIQDERMRQSMSPKELLQAIGAKFDQYLDFRQQDAHEFLRHLLDAMRMEELDVIKKRQPPPPKAKRKSKSRTKPGDPPSPSKEPQVPEIPEEDRLTSFVDMVFGGRLASILVCSKCQKISCTYEDFNDLSLPIKQDDYYHTNLLKSPAKKKDRFKSLAKKLGAGMTAASAGMGKRGRGPLRELEIPEERGPRSSSVPASPLRRSEEAEKSFELLLGDVDQRRRRRSLEAGEETPSLVTAAIREQESSSEEKTKEDKGEQMLSVPGEGQGSRPGLSEDDDQKVLDSKREKEKDEDGWIKLRRKISVSMGVKKPHHHKKKREQDVPPVPDLPKETNDDSQGDNATITTSAGEGDNDEVLDSFVDVKAPSPSVVPASLSPVPSPSPSMSPLLNATATLQRLAFVRRPSSRAEKAEKAEKSSRTNSPALSASVSNFTLSRPRTPDIPSVSLPPMVSPVEEETRTHDMRFSSQSRSASPSPASAPSGDPRPKSRKPSMSKSKFDSRTISKPSLKSRPKPRRSESLYLRRLLADVPTSSASSHAPFNLGQSQGGGWSKLGLGLGFGHGGTVQSVEGCLRMFTAVEVLEGENMVGCRRCWKIQHGQYVPREKKCVSDDDEDGEGEDEDEVEVEDVVDEGQEAEAAASDSSASLKISLIDSETRPRQDQATADESLSSSLDLSLSERISVHSAPVLYSGSRMENTQDLVRDDDAAPGLGYLNSGVSSSPALAFAVPVPSISMTSPESATATAATTTSSTSEQTPTMESPSHVHTTAQSESSARHLGSSPSRDSLQLPQASIKRPGAHLRQPAERSSTLSVMTSDASSLSSGGDTTEDEDDDGEDGETETSLTASVRSDVSSIASVPQEPPGIPRSSATLVDLSTHPPLSDRRREVSGNISSDGASNQNRSETVKNKSNGTDNTNINTTTSQPNNNTQAVPRSKQVILRRAYKRYLIACPPPVLVVHLKRFQQIGRPSSHLHSLSGLGVGSNGGSTGGYGYSQYQFFQANFKKLDDMVRFPEYFDLSPFLLPSKDEVLGEGKRSKGKRGRRGKKRRSKGDEKDREGGSEEEQEGKQEKDTSGGKVRAEGCMYRLYAVVVHIGNMLGGHYVAYTALPEPAPSLPLSSSASMSSSSAVPAPSNSSINEGNPSSSPSSASLPPSTSTQAQTQTLHPEVPRTTSFTRTANPHPHSHSHSHSHTHLRSSNVNVNSNSNSQSRPSSSSGAGRTSTGNASANSQRQPQRQWCYVSDTIVRLASLEEVLQAKAYICMYERI